MPCPCLHVANNEFYQKKNEFIYSALECQICPIDLEEFTILKLRYHVHLRGLFFWDE